MPFIGDPAFHIVAEHREYQMTVTANSENTWGGSLGGGDV